MESILCFIAMLPSYSCHPFLPLEKVKNVGRLTEQKVQLCPIVQAKKTCGKKFISTNVRYVGICKMSPVCPQHIFIRFYKTAYPNILVQCLVSTNFRDKEHLNCLRYCTSLQLNFRKHRWFFSVYDRNSISQYFVCGKKMFSILRNR